jgi:hypothetical protein
VISQERFLRSTQQHSYRMCLDYCSRRAILPLRWRLQASAFSIRGVLAVNSSTMAGREAKRRPLELDGIPLLREGER